MTTKWNALLALTALSPLTAAQVQPGDLVITYPTSGNSTIEHYAFDGTVNGIAGEWIHHDDWIASAIMPDGRWVVNCNDYSNPEIIFLDPAGTTIVHSFPYTYSNLTEDIDVFSDGTIAVCSWGEGVLLFDAVGNSSGPLLPAGMVYPFGCFVAPDDTIWVADKMDPGSDDGRLWHLDRQGTVLSSFDPGFDPSDVVLAPDGTLWISDMAGEIAHYHVDGTLILKFPAQIDSSGKTLWSLAVTDDGLVWATGHYDTMVRAYDENGVVVSEFDTAAPGHSTFTFTIPGSSWATPFCLGDGSTGYCACGNEAGAGEGCMNSTGSGALLSAAGASDVSLDSLGFNATGMIPGQLAMLFVANNRLGGGAGIAFGDGLRCTGGGLVRLGVEVVDAGGGASWGPGLGATGGWGAGEIKRFQVWYQDPSAGSPCATGFNLTHGLEVVFQP